VKTGILLVNLGTPDAPTPRALSRYLNQFLTDPRVIGYPFLKRQLLVRGIIVPLRHRKSAKMYEQIWTEKGSPLLFHSKDLREALQVRLGDEYVVALGMRYQNPSIKSGLKELEMEKISRLIILPLFPHYTSTTTGSAYEEVMKHLGKWESVPDLNMISRFPTLPGMIETFAENALPYLKNPYDQFLFSFHGLPEHKNKHYSDECAQTAHAIAKVCRIPKDQVIISFQSRLGRGRWIGPYTKDVLREMASSGNRRVLVFCPSFVCDCLETLYEIGIEEKRSFLAAGGETLDLVPGLNVQPRWIETIKNLISRRG